ncbi:hypothetical protein [Thauera sp.]|uniref:hypothetical protein n=1 Tax=Thauera sp. TaxID=1905334 RepID=UPI0039E61330
MNVRVRGEGNRTAGGNYTEDRSVGVIHLNIGKLSVGEGSRIATRVLLHEDLHAQHQHLREVGRALRRRFVLHRTVLVFATCCGLFVAALLAGWGAPPRSPVGALVLIVGFGGVIPSALWMVRERNALYAELRRNRAERFALECALVRAEAEAEALAQLAKPMKTG